MHSVNEQLRCMVSESEIAEPVQINVEVAYATPEKQQILALTVEPGTTLEQTVEQSGILNLFPEIDLSVNKIGIFGKLGKKTAEIKPGERVVRRKREAEGKKMKKGST